MPACRYCGKEIIWVEKDGRYLPYDPLPDGNGGLKPGSPHRCRAVAPKRKNECPVCRILAGADITKMSGEELAKPLCPEHDGFVLGGIVIHGKKDLVRYRELVEKIAGERSRNSLIEQFF